MHPFSPVDDARCAFGEHSLRHIRRETFKVDRAARAAMLRQTPRCFWFTGLSGAGKSTLANAFEQQLHASGQLTYLLDGDNVRNGLNHDLGFSALDRAENIRRIGEVARLIVDAGLIVLVSTISPFRRDRDGVRQLFEAGQFVEVFVDAPLAVCEQRDVKGLYAKARRGEVRHFTGLSSPYEVPLSPELVLPTHEMSPEACVERLLLQAKS